MRDIPAALLAKIQSHEQTKANNADPAVHVWLTRPSTAMTTSAYQEYADNVITTSTNLTGMDLAVSHPSIDGPEKFLICAYCDDGVTHVLKAALTDDWEDIDWTQYSTFNKAAEDVSVICPGIQKTRADGAPTIETNGSDTFPGAEIFWLHDGTVKTMGLDTPVMNPPTVATGCSKVSATFFTYVADNVKRYAEIAFLVTTGGDLQFTHNRPQPGVWSTPATITGPTGITFVDVAAFHTWHDKVGCQALGSDGHIYDFFADVDDLDFDICIKRSDGDSGASGVARSLGGVVDYYDREAQSLYGGAQTWGALKTVVFWPAHGGWATPASHPRYESGVDVALHAQRCFEHVNTGAVYWIGAYQHVDRYDISVFRYHYAANVSQYVNNVQIEARQDTNLKQANFTFANIGKEFFISNTVLFQPGCRLQVALTMGDSEPYPMGEYFMDTITYDEYGQTVTASCRNAFAALQDCVFGTDNTLAEYWSEKEFAEWIFSLGEVYKYLVYDYTPFSEPGSATYEYGDTLISAFVASGLYYVPAGTDRSAFGETGDGFILRGPRTAFVETYMPHGTFEFKLGDVFSRKITKSKDRAYDWALMTGKQISQQGVETPLVSQKGTQYPQYWAVQAHRIAIGQYPLESTDQQLLDWETEAWARTLDNAGINQVFTMPIQPHVLPSDKAALSEDGGTTYTTLGFITSVVHTMGYGGFTTQITVDSAGVRRDGSTYTGVKPAQLDGYNRNQNMADLISVIAKK